MGKSLRSKSKLKAKAFKRSGEFQKAVDQRTQRLFEKSQEELIKQKIKEQEEAKINENKANQQKEEEGENDDNDDDAMKVDDEKDGKKVSTSGYRTARHHLYKKNKKAKQNNMAFKKRK